MYIEKRKISNQEIKRLSSGISIIVIIVFIFLFFGFWNTQVLKNFYFTTLANRNIIKDIEIKAHSLCGEIIDYINNPTKPYQIGYHPTVFEKIGKPFFFCGHRFFFIQPIFLQKFRGKLFDSNTIFDPNALLWIFGCHHPHGDRNYEKAQHDGKHKGIGCKNALGNWNNAKDFFKYMTFCSRKKAC